MAQPWDANLYEGKYDFVWRHGAALLDLLAPAPGERVLDLGCGTGHLTARITQSGASVVGLDSAAEMLAQARDAYPALTFVQGDARAFTFDPPFDAVFSNAVLHWIPDAPAVARCIQAALKPGGRFVAEFGGRGNVRAIVAALGAAGAEAPAWYFPTVGEYATVLEASGLEVRFAVLFDRPTPLDGPHGLRDWLRMFARATLDAVPAERHEGFLAAVEDAARPALAREGGWVADYRRLRVVAVRP